MNNNKWREVASIVLLVVVAKACLLASVAAGEPDAKELLLLGLAPNSNQTTGLAPTTTTDETPTEAPAGPVDANATTTTTSTSTAEDEPEGQSRSFGGRVVKEVFPWIVTMHSWREVLWDHKFCGVGIMVEAGRMLVHMDHLFCMYEHEVEMGEKTAGLHEMRAYWPALASFNDSRLTGSQAIGFMRKERVHQLVVLATSDMHQETKYPAPSELPQLPGAYENPTDDCFVYSWKNTEGQRGLNGYTNRTFAKMPVTVSECARSMCTLKLPDPFKLCKSQGDLGLPVLCKGKLSYMVSNIKNVGCDNWVADIQMMSEIPPILLQLSGHTIKPNQTRTQHITGNKKVHRIPKRINHKLATDSTRKQQQQQQQQATKKRGHKKGARVANTLAPTNKGPPKG